MVQEESMDTKANLILCSEKLRELGWKRKSITYSDLYRILNVYGVNDIQGQLYRQMIHEAEASCKITTGAADAIPYQVIDAADDALHAIIE
jgi:virulence-associated protein VapD